MCFFVCEFIELDRTVAIVYGTCHDGCEITENASVLNSFALWDLYQIRRFSE